jgi:hypothetical protein
MSAGTVYAAYAFPKINELAAGDETFTREMKASCVVELEECSLNLRESILDLEELETALTAVRITIHNSADEAERDRLVREIEAVCAATARRLRESLLEAEPVR